MSEPYYNVKHTCESYSDVLADRGFFDVMIDEAYWTDSFRTHDLFEAMIEQASKNDLVLPDLDDWDYDTYFTDLYDNTEKGIS